MTSRRSGGMKQLPQNEFWLARRDPLARLGERRPHLRRRSRRHGRSILWGCLRACRKSARPCTASFRHRSFCGASRTWCIVRSERQSGDHPGVCQFCPKSCRSILLSFPCPPRCVTSPRRSLVSGQGGGKLSFAKISGFLCGLLFLGFSSRRISDILTVNLDLCLSYVICHHRPS
jgi:hypothetical protein